MPSYSLVSLIGPKVRVVRRKRWGSLIAVCLLKKPPDVVADEVLPGLHEQWLKSIL